MPGSLPAAAGATEPGAGAAAAVTPVPFSIVCLSPQEWHVALPTNRQQIMRRAAARGHEVLFVETGEFLGKHVLRLLRGPSRGSLLRRLVTGERVVPGVTVRKTLNLLPWGQRYAMCDRLNGRLGAVLVRLAARSLRVPRVTWLYDPRATWAAGAVGDELAVYDCVDDYPEQAAGRRNRAYIAAADRRAAGVSRLVFATTNGLVERHRATNQNTFLVRNVGDYEHFAPAADRTLARPDLEALPRPVLGFAGNISAGKVDVELLARLAEHDESRTLLLAGPADVTLAPAIARLAERPNVTWIGPVPYDDLPAVVAAFDVGLIPYAANSYTRNVSPLKLYEYLAAGKPVVATGLPELAGMEPDVAVAEAGAIESAIEQALRLRTDADVERRRMLAAANTWETRAARLIDLVIAELAA